MTSTNAQTDDAHPDPAESGAAPLARALSLVLLACATIIVLATVYQAFDVTRVGAADAVHEKFSFTVSPVGIRVRMHRRPPAA